MPHSILITGGSGYLGGSLLAQLRHENLPLNTKLFALVRSEGQAKSVKQYGAEALILNLEDQDAVIKAIIDIRITIIYFLIDAVKSEYQVPMIKALADVKKQTGQEVHFLHTSGAKLFSEHAGMPTDRIIRDTDPDLYEMQKAARAPYQIMAQCVNTNNTVIELAESYGVRSYIFIPCIVYGEGEGFGNRISIQTVAVVKAARGVGAVYDINPGGVTWPVCHIKDNTGLYVALLKSIMSGESPSHGKNGYYLASSGSVAWIDIYTAMARSLAKRGVIPNQTVLKVDDAVLGKMAQALQCPKNFVAIQLGGLCTLKAENGSRIGWKAESGPEHILETADTEVRIILENLKD